LSEKLLCSGVKLEINFNTVTAIQIEIDARFVVIEWKSSHPADFYSFLSTVTPLEGDFSGRFLAELLATENKRN